MTRTIDLRKGDVYFLVGFFDTELRIPMINTYIYDGMNGDDHLFISARGYLKTSKQPTLEDAHYISFPDGKINGILDKEGLIEWLSEEHSPGLVGRTYEYRAT